MPRWQLQAFVAWIAQQWLFWDAGGSGAGIVCSAAGAINWMAPFSNPIKLTKAGIARVQVH
jgi:hypothetical protein